VIVDLRQTIDPVLREHYPSMELAVRVRSDTCDYDLLNRGTSIGTLDAVMVERASQGEILGMSAVLLAVDKILVARKAQFDPVADAPLADTALLTGERKAAYDEFTAAAVGVDGAQKQQAAAMDRYKSAIARLSRAALGDAK